ncbi:methylglyoxal synthase [Terasakiella sp. SH-1]|uniref:methylglyoxal synthase n=1 Tax=Terasakiella sp. SH-1 TaxID=2560057 RepID=UPI001073EC93|nr:methylglyoxal synthase [Terasakiella sp. SH-1]
MSKPLAIGLVAHDAMKANLVGWVTENKERLAGHRFYGTGTTSKTLLEAHPELDLTPLKSGPLGGDQQLGALICEGKLDALIFFQDPMTAQPHDVDVKALVRLSTLYDVPIACNPATANLIVTSPAFSQISEHRLAEREERWTSYLNRSVSKT